jgi:hypothetical protein
MAVFNEPSKWQTSLVNSGDANTIPQSTPAGTGEASFEDGFPQITQVPIGAGGIAPDRKDFNGLFKILGDWIFFAQNGGLPSYSANFDYVVGRYVVYNNILYKCIQANGASSTVVAPDSVSPLGSDYWKDIENQEDTSTSLIPNQIIQSPVPLTDANLHLLDGALLSGSGAYSAYVAMMGELYNTDPTATCWTDEATWQTSVTTYGECGKFVYDSVNNTLRLPKLASFVQATTTANELGTLVEAGAPNITGHAERSGGGSISEFSVFTSSTGAITFSTASHPGISGSTSVVGSNSFDFDASLSNPIYGNSNTIQPQAIKYYFYIVVGTVSKTNIQIDIDNVMTDLALKADKDFTNIDNTAKIAMAHNAMPSDTYDDISWGASGDTYTATADGYFIAQRQTTGSNQYLDIRNSTTGLGSRIAYASSGSTLIAFLPVKKGDVITITYTAGTASTLRFIYAVGTESEQ